MRSLLLTAVLGAVLSAAPAGAQFAETARPLPVVTDGTFAASAVQIGRRVFLGGGFRSVSAPTGGAVVVDVFGRQIPNAFPRVDGPVSQIVPGGVGGWFLVGDFTSVAGQPVARFSRVTPQRTVDPRYRINVDGPVTMVAVAHGRVYVAGTFTSINGVTRRGLAAISVATGQLEGWGRGFTPGDRVPGALSASSIGVYLVGWGSSGDSRLWGFDAATGQQWFSRSVFANAIAASSARVYVGTFGSSRPLLAVDPITGGDTTWAPDLRFEYLSGTYGDYTSISGLLLDEGRLYFGGYFRATGGRYNLAAVDAATGATVDWRPVVGGGPLSSRTGRLLTLGPAIAVTTGEGRPLVFGVATGGPRVFDPQTYGGVATMAAAPEGVVIGGDFNGLAGTARAGLAAVNLDTGALDPWTSAFLPGLYQGRVRQLATDGTWLFVRTSDSKFIKIDPDTGAIVGELQVTPGEDYVNAPMRVVGGEIVTAVWSPTGASELGAIAIAAWTYRGLPFALGGISPSIRDLDVAGTTVYLAGGFQTINGATRPHMGAVDLGTGQVLPWRPQPDRAPDVIRASSGRVWAGGAFRRIGGQRRRGLAELDPVSGAARAWNPDASGVWVGSFVEGVGRLDVDVDGTLYATLGGPFDFPFGGSDSGRPTVGGQRTPLTLAFSTLTGRRLPWRPSRPRYTAILHDCMLVADGCVPRAPSPPLDLRVQQAGNAVTLRWTLPLGTPGRTGVRVEVGTAEGQADLGTVDLPAGETSISAPLPAGRYFARVRSLAGATASLTTDDVSFAAGPPDVPAAPLDVTAVGDGSRVTVAWQPPSTGVPPRYELEAGTREGGRDLGAVNVAGSATRVTLDVPPGTYWARLVAVNGAGRSAPGTELLISLGPRQSCNIAPLAPSGLVATVTGRTVSLSWGPPVDGPQVEQQKLVVASAPGLADLFVLDLGISDMSFSATTPPGTYYARVIADNLCGVTASSNEVRVVVP